MTTITLRINERTKAGKAFLEMTNVLIRDSEGIELVTDDLSATQKKWVNNLKTSIKETKEVASGKRKRKTLNSFLNEI